MHTVTNIKCPPIHSHVTPCSVAPLGAPLSGTCLVRSLVRRPYPTLSHLSLPALQRLPAVARLELNMQPLLKPEVPYLPHLSIRSAAARNAQPECGLTLISPTAL